MTTPECEGTLYSANTEKPGKEEEKHRSKMGSQAAESGAECPFKRRGPLESENLGKSELARSQRALGVERGGPLSQVAVGAGDSKAVEPSPGL